MNNNDKVDIINKTLEFIRDIDISKPYEDFYLKFHEVNLVLSLNISRVSFRCSNSRLVRLLLSPNKIKAKKIITERIIYISY